MHAILGEAVLRCLVGGPEVTRQQLAALAVAAERPNVTLQVLPFAAGANAGMDGKFTVLTFPDPGDPPVAYVEGNGGSSSPASGRSRDTRWASSYAAGQPGPGSTTATSVRCSPSSCRVRTSPGTCSDSARTIFRTVPRPPPYGSPNPRIAGLKYQASAPTLAGRYHLGGVADRLGLVQPGGRLNRTTREAIVSTLLRYGPDLACAPFAERLHRRGCPAPWNARASGRFAPGQAGTPVGESAPARLWQRPAGPAATAAASNLEPLRRSRCRVLLLQATTGRRRCGSRPS